MVTASVPCARVRTQSNYDGEVIAETACNEF